MKGFKTIYLKEIRRVFKDKKLIFSMFILPLFLVIGICFLMMFLMENMQDDIEKHVSLVYLLDAPQAAREIIAGIDGVSVEEITDVQVDEVKDKIKTGDADILLAFPKDFEKTVQAESGVPEIKTFYNSSEDYSVSARAKVVEMGLETYRQMLIEARYGNAEAVMIFSVDKDNEEADIVDSDKATGKFLGMIIPYIMTMLIFAGAMGFGIDSIAGEKERGTLTSLLLAPVKRVEIVMGKVVALGTLSILSATVYVIGMLVVLPFGVKNFAGADVLDKLSFSFSANQVIQFVVLIIGIVILYVSIIGIVAVFAKNTKEAQSYIAPVYIIVILAGMITMYSSGNPDITSYMIPLYNVSAAFKGIFTESITTAELLTTAIVTYGTAALLIGLTAKAFKSEKIMLNA